MKPLNVSERNKAFRNFLIFFIITIAIIIAAVFFSVQVDAEENRQLKDEKKVTERQRDFTEEFVDKMETTIKLLDSVNLPNVKSHLIDAAIDDNLDSMLAMTNNDTSAQLKSLYKNIVYNFYDLQGAKKQLREASGNDATFSKLQKENDQLHSRLSEANSLVLEYRRLYDNCQQQK